MSLQYSVALRNAQLDSVESVPGTAALFEIFVGSPPANCAAADSGTKLASFALPSDWMTAASSGSKGKNGTWSGTAIADGTAGHFRIKDSGGTTCHIQGTISESGGGGDAIIDNDNIATGQAVTVSGFTVSAGNA